MADTITDNRTLDNANQAADQDLDDLSGSADTGGDNTEVFINGNASRSFKASQAVVGRLHDYGSAQDRVNQHFFGWIKCTSLTDTLANGGVRIRFCGATVTDWFEKYIYGGNIGSITGWEMAMVDIEKARADAVGGIDGGTNGTTPATNAIRYWGFVFDVPGMVTGNTDNCFIGAMHRLPQNTPGIIVQGQDQTGGAHDWNFQDIVEAGDVADTSKAWGTVVKSDGITKFSTPIRFGANDATTHGFSDTLRVLGWKEELVADDFYSWEIIGGSGTQSFTLGVKAGSGDAAVGSQGVIVTAAIAGPRWRIDANDSNIDKVEFFACLFDHTNDININNTNVEMRSCSLVDGNTVLQTGSVFQKNNIIQPNTVEAVEYITTDDMTDIKNCNFVKGITGHAIKLTIPRVASQNSLGNIFFNYGYAQVTFNTGTDVDGTNEELDLTAHPYSTGDPIVYDDDGGAQNIGLTDQTTYWIRNLTVNSISIHTSRADANSDTARVNLTAGGSETHILWSADAGLLNDSDGAVTVNVSGGGGTPTFRNQSTTESTTVDNTVTVTITVEDEAGTELASVNVRIEEDPSGTLISQGATNGIGVFSFSYNYSADQNIKIITRDKNFFFADRIGTITVDGFSIVVNLADNPIVDKA